MKKIISIFLAFALIFGSLAILASCDGKGSGTEEKQSESSTDPGTDPGTDSETGGTNETEEETGGTVTPPDDTVVYDNGASISGSGVTWAPNAFSTTENVIDESKAVEITAEELIAKLIVRDNDLTKDDVYKVVGPLTLTSGKYYGNFASIIVPDGIVIDSGSEIVVKELIAKGDITIKNTSSVTFFKLNLQGGDTAITIDESSSDIAFKSCRIQATDTAFNVAGDGVTIYQNYIFAKNGVVSTADNLTVQASEIISADRAIISSGEYPIIKNNSISLSSNGIGVELTSGSYNALVALNIISDAQLSVKVSEAYNAVVLLNSAVKIIGENNTNLYVVENKLGGYIHLINNEYLLCDGNTFPKNDEKPHPVLDDNNTKMNGDNLHDISERVQYGANEKLLPHTNKDLFVGMERLNKVKDASLTKSYNINKYIRNCAKSGNVVIVPPGAYVSTSMLSLGGAHSNTTVYGYGVYHEAADYGTTLQLDRTNNFTLKGLTLGYAKQSSGQIYVLDKLGNNRLLVVAAAGYDKDFGKSNSDVYSTSYTDMFHAGEFTCWKGIGGAYKVIEKNPDGTMVFEIIDADGNPYNGDDSPKIYQATGIGDIWACRMGGSNKQSIYIYRCYNFLMKDCVVYGYAAALAITAASMGDNLQLERVHNTVHSPYVISEEEFNFYRSLEETYGADLEISIDSLGRYRGSIPRVGSVDATHVIGTETGLHATSCLFESMCDDGSNQRGSSSRLHRIIKNDDGTTTLIYKGTISETYYWLNQQNGVTESSGTETSGFTAGQRIFVYASNGKILCDTEVLTDSTLYSNNKYMMGGPITYTYQGEQRTLQYSCYLRQVKVRSDSIEWLLDEDGNETDVAAALVGYNLNDNSYKMDHKVLVDNISLNSTGFTFDNVLVQNTRSRGILVKTRDATVKNCTFRDLAMTGVLLSVETTWGESSVPQNVLVQGCLFDGTSGGFGSESDLKYAPIAIQGLGELSNKVTVSEKTLPCMNIRIIGNKFVNNSNNYCITVSAAQGITITDNVFTAREGDTEKKFGRAIHINGCMNVNISGNTYSEIVPDVTKAIIALNYKGLTGSDVVDADGNRLLPEFKDPTQ